MIANGAIAVVGDVFGPAVAAITLGLYRRSQLARRMGRNAAFDTMPVTLPSQLRPVRSDGRSHSARCSCSYRFSLFSQRSRYSLSPPLQSTMTEQEAESRPTTRNTLPLDCRFC